MKSDPEYSFVFSAEAHDDLVDIQSYTFSTYGEGQWIKYNILLDQAMKKILQNPLLGHIRDDVPDQYRTWKVESHVLIYRIDSELIYLVRVLHKRMNFTLKFE